MTSAEVLHDSQVLVALPTFNNAATLASVIAGVRLHARNVLVVDDGSTDSTSAILAATTGIAVQTLAVNRGKGAALMTAMQHARANGYATVVTIDSDGQHAPADLPAIMRAAAQNPDTIIIGDRQLDIVSDINIPKSSKFGRAFSDFWVRLETGLAVRDTQSGFRAYPVQRLPLRDLKKSRYDFEIEILVRSMWDGIRTKSVPIGIYYPKASERVSHFDPWRDNLRLTWLHTCLCTRRIFSLCLRLVWHG